MYVNIGEGLKEIAKWVVLEIVAAAIADCVVSYMRESKEAETEKCNSSE